MAFLLSLSSEMATLSTARMEERFPTRPNLPAEKSISTPLLDLSKSIPSSLTSTVHMTMRAFSRPFHDGPGGHLLDQLDERDFLDVLAHNTFSDIFTSFSGLYRHFFFGAHFFFLSDPRLFLLLANCSCMLAPARHEAFPG